MNSDPELYDENFILDTFAIMHMLSVDGRSNDKISRFSFFELVIDVSLFRSGQSAGESVPSPLGQQIEVVQDNKTRIY